MSFSLVFLMRRQPPKSTLFPFSPLSPYARSAAFGCGVRFPLCPPRFSRARLRERPLDTRGALSVFRTRGSHGRLTDFGFLRSDDFGFSPEREDLRLAQRVRRRRAVLDWDRVAVSLDHLEPL